MREDAVFRLSGLAQNIGIGPWSNSATSSPYRLGLRIYSESQELLREMRADFQSENLAPGDSFPFCFTFWCRSFSAPPRYLHLGMVKEREFWFTDRGDQATVVDLSEVKPSTNSSLVKEDIPLNSNRIVFFCRSPVDVLSERTSRFGSDCFKELARSELYSTVVYEDFGWNVSVTELTGNSEDTHIKYLPDSLGALADLSEAPLACIFTDPEVACRNGEAVRTLLPYTRIVFDTRFITCPPSLELLHQLDLLQGCWRPVDEVWCDSDERAIQLRPLLRGVRVRVIADSISLLHAVQPPPRILLHFLPGHGDERCEAPSPLDSVQSEFASVIRIDSDGVVREVSDGSAVNLEPIFSGNRVQGRSFASIANEITRKHPSFDIVLVREPLQFTGRSWLRDLVSSSYRSSRLAAVGGVMVDNIGLIVDAGGHLSTSGYLKSFAARLTPSQLVSFSSSELGYPCTKVVYIRGEAVAEIGSFNENLIDPQLAIAEWCARAHVAGFKIGYSADCVATVPDVRTAHRESDCLEERGELRELLRGIFPEWGPR